MTSVWIEVCAALWYLDFGHCGQRVKCCSSARMRIAFSGLLTPTLLSAANCLSAFFSLGYGCSVKLGYHQNSFYSSRFFLCYIPQNPKLLLATTWSQWALCRWLSFKEKQIVHLPVQYPLPSIDVMLMKKREAVMMIVKGINCFYQAMKGKLFSLPICVLLYPINMYIYLLIFEPLTGS